MRRNREQLCEKDDDELLGGIDEELGRRGADPEALPGVLITCAAADLE